MILFQDNRKGKVTRNPQVPGDSHEDHQEIFSHAL